ncbi:MAG: DUF4846 domain-containing protein [Acidobacteriota bacterium]
MKTPRSTLHAFATILIAASSPWIASPSTAEPFPWAPTATESLVERFPPPEGFERVRLADDSFGAWLRTLPLKPDGSPVLLHDGRVKSRDVHVAVVDLDVGRRDLQQCADTAMRLRAEYLWSIGCADDVAFDFTSGDRAAWSAWRDGRRPRVAGNTVTWRQAAEPDASYRTFRRYLDTVFVYAGSHSLARELLQVDDPGRPEPGQVFIQGGFPGHAVVILDVARNADGEHRMLLGQSYMPAQELHVLRQPGDESPWYPSFAAGPLDTPEWRFDHTDLRRFPSLACERPTTREPLQVGGDVQRPRKVAGAKPLRLDESGCPPRRDRVLIVRAVIDETGRVDAVEWLKGDGDACIEGYVRETLADWRFEPATLDGEPVSVYYNLSVRAHHR